MAFVRTVREFPFDQVLTQDDLPVDEISGPEPEYETSGLGQFPVEVSYEKWFEWIWRVRSWRAELACHVGIATEEVAGEFTPARSYDSDADYSFDQVVSWGTYSGTPPAAWDEEVTYFSTSGPSAPPLVSYSDAWWFCVASNIGEEPGDESAYWRRISRAENAVDAEELALVCAGRSRPVSGDWGATEADAVDWNETIWEEPPVSDSGSFAAISALLVRWSGADPTPLPAWKRHGDLWLPNLWIELTLNGHILRSVHIDDYTVPDGESYTHATVNMTLDGHTIPLQYVSGMVWPDGSTASYDIASFSLDLSPYEWYPMDPADGDGPVYDSATGERTARAMPNP